MELARLGKGSLVPKSGWLWVPVLGVGLVAVLAGRLPPGGLVDVARPAALRGLGGDFAFQWPELVAIAAVAAWMVAKPLAVIGALFWLELRFAPIGSRRNYLLGWAAQALMVSFIIAFTTMLSLLDVFPEPLIKVEEAAGPWGLLLISLPAFLLNLLVMEFFQYWGHRAFHHFPLLWRFHALHHSLDINVLNNVAHPIDTMLMILFVGFTTTLLIGASQEQLLLLVAFTSIQSHINHTRLPIHLGRLGGTLLCDNRYHYIHHSLDPAHHDKNFADRFPVMDMLFGTYVAPVAEPLPVGLSDRAPPDRLSQYLTLRLPPRAEDPAPR